MKALLAVVAALVTAFAISAKAEDARLATHPAASATMNLIAAISDGAEQRHIFAANTHSTAAREPLPVRTALLDKLAHDSGGLDLIHLTTPSARLADAIVTTRRGEHFARLVVFTDAEKPEKIARLFVLPTRDPAKAAEEAWPEDPIPASRLPDEIAWRLERLSKDDHFSGVVLVGDGDRVIFRRAYGYADHTWQIPNRADTAFHAGSTTKMLTAAAILKLVEQKRLSLDDTLAARVPAFPHAQAGAAITLRHLLSHTAGLADWDGRQPTAQTSTALIHTMTDPPVRPPGVQFVYSNAGFVLLGAVLENVTGLTFEDALRSLVLDPVGMARTAAWPVTAIVANRATGYLRPADDPLAIGPRYANHQYLGYKGDGSGGLYTTVDDLFVFHRAIVDGKLLGPDATALFLTATSDFPGTPRPSTYGLGVRLTHCAGQPVFGHSGGGANSGVSTATFATRDGRWTVIVLSNYDTVGEQLAQDLCDVAARREDTRVPVASE